VPAEATVEVAAWVTVDVTEDGTVPDGHSLPNVGQKTLPKYKPRIITTIATTNAMTPTITTEPIINYS
jgi:hypothetical protein